MASMTPSNQYIMVWNYHAELQRMEQGVSTSCVHDRNTDWRKWTKLATWIGIHTNVCNMVELVPILQILSHWVCNWILAESGFHIQKICSINNYNGSVISLPQWGPSTPTEHIGKYWISFTSESWLVPEGGNTPTHIQPNPLSLTLHIKYMY